MDNKLTLKLDNQVIKKAKLYARKKNMSLSKLIESYLEYLTSNTPNSNEEVTPLVKSLSGVLGSSQVNDHKASYKKYLKKKYSK